MNFYKISRLISLHEKAEQHSNEYKRLLRNCSARSKALWHLRKAMELRYQISGLIRDLVRLRTDPEKGLQIPTFPQFRTKE